MIVLLIMILSSISNAGVSIAIKNKTTIEFDLDKNIKPYLANEIEVSPDGLTLFDKNKFFIGFKYNANSNVKIDPHFFLQKQRKNNWMSEYGPVLRMDFTF